MTDRWACEKLTHEGDPGAVHRLDRFTRRQTFMRADGGQRLHEISLDRICRKCIEVEVREKRQMPGQTALV